MLDENEGDRKTEIEGMINEIKNQIDAKKQDQAA